VALGIAPGSAFGVALGMAPGSAFGVALGKVRRWMMMKRGRGVAGVRVGGVAGRNSSSAHTTGGSDFGAVPAATGHSRQHRSRSTWGLVYRFIESICSLVSRYLA
jgi:hypothetical protein